MIEREQWDFHPEWLDYVKRSWEGRGRVEQIKVETSESLAFKARATRAFEDHGIPVKTVKTYLSVQVPKTGDGYDEHYPHIHYPLNATTLVHYLQPGDIPAPLNILEDGEVIESIVPEQGLTVFMPNSTWHGVLRNKGTVDRIQLIATALR